jgi:flavodoxin
MTRALVVYESLFGDARTIAEAIADGLAPTLPADVVAAADAPAEIGPDVTLLVVGGPNHAFGMPRPSTREGAVKQYGAEIADSHAGLHEWLVALRLPAGGVAAAAFDTRGGGHPVLTKLDHAARTEEKLLSTAGARVVAPAEHFFVVDAQGPLVDGEEDRARAWGQTLARTATVRPVGS